MKSELPTLRELRRLAKAQGLCVHRLGGQWIKSAWSDGYQANVETPMHYSLNDAPERVALAAALGV